MSPKINGEVAYFTRVRGLASIVWDPANNRPLAEFNKQGLLGTTDRRVAAELRKLGYKQVTAEMLEEAGLAIPGSEKPPEPGRGYLQGAGGSPSLAGAVSSEGVVDRLFDPDIDEVPTPPRSKKGGKRSIVG